MVIIVFGLPGAGKTYFAEKLAARLGAVYTSSDVLRKQMFPAPQYTDTEKEAVYNEMLIHAVRSIINGRDVVLDATFYRESLRRQAYDALCSLCGVYFVEVIASDNVVMPRLLKPRAASDANIEVYKKLKAVWEPFAGSHLVLSSGNDNIEEMMATMLSFLSKHDISTN